jgi:hypothetical protein
MHITLIINNNHAKVICHKIQLNNLPKEKK